MKYAIQQSVFRSTDKVETAPFAQITVTESLSGDAANLWSDVNGITSISGNVFVADENGFFRFYVTSGQYDLEIQSDGITSNINDIVVGPSSAQSSSVQHYQGGMIHAAHRGYAAHSIENTMTSFSKAIAYRADALELDVQISSDGVPVVIHDLTVDYSTTSSGNVKDFTAAELKAMTRDARYGAIYEKSYIPTFAEVVALAKTHQIQIWPEVKGYRTPDDIALMVQVVKDAGYEHMTKFQSFTFSDLPIVRSLSSIVSLGHANGATDFRTYADDLLALGGECWIVTSIAKALLHPEYVAELQDRGIQVALYTAYWSSDVAKAESTGADAVICDRNLKGTR